MPNATESSNHKAKSSISLNHLVLLVCLLVAFYFGYESYTEHKIEQVESSTLILSPQANDIYFLDFRKIDEQLVRKNKYKLAKVIRISDDNVAIVYGSFFYQWQYSVVNSIKHGDLSNNDYFELIPDYIPFTKIKEMQRSGAIYLVKRPVRNKLYGNFVSPE
ncbi:MAG: hypothetical protein P8I03_09410 [Thalassotalea sp.]|nr:hypothetical protein [Thalassotalea sp.]